MYESQVLPQQKVNDDVYFGYGSKGRWNMSYSSNRDELRDFYVDYAKEILNTSSMLGLTWIRSRPLLSRWMK